MTTCTIAKNSTGTLIAVPVVDCPDGTTVDLTGATITAELKKPDGSKITAASGALNGNTFIITTTQAETDMVGTWYGELEVSGIPTGYAGRTSPFEYEVVDVIE